MKMTYMAYCYAAIGNTDNTLSQQSWSDFVMMTRRAIGEHSHAIHIEGHSLGDKPWQNCVFGFDIPADKMSKLQQTLKGIARQFHQESICWTEGKTEFLKGAEG